MDTMDSVYPPTRPPRRRRWMGCLVFLFGLVFLVAGSIPALLNIPGVQARFNGAQTTALVKAAATCGQDDEDGSGFFYTYIFADLHGQNYRITDDVTCSSGIVSDGEHVTIWYQPDHPEHFMTANDWTFDSIFFAGFSIPMVFILILFVFSNVRPFFRSRPPSYPNTVFSNE